MGHPQLAVFHEIMVSKFSDDVGRYMFFVIFAGGIPQGFPQMTQFRNLGAHAIRKAGRHSVAAQVLQFPTDEILLHLIKQFPVGKNIVGRQAENKGLILMGSEGLDHPFEHIFQGAAKEGYPMPLKQSAKCIVARLPRRRNDEGSPGVCRPLRS